jgi:amidohydrolase
MKRSYLLSFLLFFLATISSAQVSSKLQAKLDQQVSEIEKQVIEWRRYFHQHPELSNREVKTGEKIAELLKSFGIEVQHPVAKTGVVGILKGDQPGPVVALRADIDGLPVTERNSLSFASKERSTFSGQETGVMHACGHDSHMAMLLGVAQILAKNKSDIKGTVKFLFQPAEEGPPPGEEGGARLMLKEGVFENPKVDVVFGLHIQSLVPLGTINYRPGAFMASPGGFTIKVKGKQAHGATPWDGIDPIVVSSQIVLGLQTIVSRQTELTKLPAIITVGTLHSGIRSNIIPEEATLTGTTRTFDLEMQKVLHDKIRLTATNIAESAGATAEVTLTGGYAPTYNDPSLTERMVPSLKKAAGEKNVFLVNPVTMAEDFSAYQEKVPGLFFFLGAYDPEAKFEKQPVHHTPDFMIDERAFKLGVKAMLNLTLDYMYAKK